MANRMMVGLLGAATAPLVALASAAHGHAFALDVAALGAASGLLTAISATPDPKAVTAHLRSACQVMD